MATEHTHLPSLPVLLHRARMLVAARYKSTLRKYNLTDPQYRVLTQIARGELSTISEIAARQDLKPSSLTRIVRDLEHRGLLRRLTGKDDARQTIPVLTGEGRDFVETVLVEIRPRHQAINRMIGPDLVMTLQVDLARLIDRLNEVPDDR